MIEATPEHVARGSALVFIGHGDGGPNVIIPNVVLDRYTGAEGFDDGDSDYEDVCDAGLVMPFEDHELLVLQEEGSTTWIPEGDGGLLLRWVGADSGAALLAAVQGAAFTPVGIWNVPDGGLTLMHATEDGRVPPEERYLAWMPIALRAGRYMIEELVGGAWNGSVAFPDGHVEKTTMMCYRLRLE